VIETAEFRVTISTQKQGPYEAGALRGLTMIYVRIENLTDEPMLFDPASAYLQLVSGRSLRRIPPDEAVGILQDAPATRMLMSMARKDNPALIASNFKRRELAAGPIQPHSWREGLVYFEGIDDSGRKKIPVRIFLLPFVRDGVSIHW
jgi:hypothetical protein